MIDDVAEAPTVVVVGGQELVLPAGASDEQIRKAVDSYKASPDFEETIDKESGAPSRVRAFVGGAPPNDRLANLQRFFPDATPYGEDNFVYSDPGTGRPTLYNPKGLDLGDVASVGREATQTVFSAGGAVAGTLAGMASGAPAGPGGVVVQGQRMGVAGAGLGNAAGGFLFDVSMNLLADRVDTRTPTQVGADTLLDFGTGAVGQRVGDLAGEGAKAALGGGKSAAKRLVRQFRALGIDPPAGAVSGRTVGGLEKALETSPASSQIMQESAERVLGQTRDAAERLANSFGPVQTSQGAGETIRKAGVRVAERFRFTQEKAYDTAFELIGDDTQVSVRAVSDLRKVMEEELSRAPESLKKALSPAIRQLKAIEADAAEEGIPFDALRQVRTMVGRDIDNPMLVASSGARNEAMKRIYGALTQDMSEAARANGAIAGRKLDVADRFTRQFMNTSNDTLQKIANFEADERAFSYAMTSAKDGGTALARLRRNFTPEEWDTVTGSVLGRLGLARPGAQDASGEVFSVNTFMTNWNKLAPEAKEALFGGKRYEALRPELDRLVEVISSLKGVERLTNTSNTARNLVAFSTISTLGGSLGLALGGDVESAGGGVASAILGTVVAPRVAAKLITSPAFVKWLTTPVTSPGSVSAHIGRLSAIAVAQPEIREEVHAYIRALGDKE